MPIREQEPQPPHQGRGQADGTEPTGYRPLRLTARGAVLGIIVVSFGAALLGPYLRLPSLSGAAFLAVCLFVTLFVRRTDLLTLSVHPPLAYFLGALGAETAGALGAEEPVRTVAFGMGTHLAEVAPWLFFGTALVLIVAVFRGLPGNIREFSEALSARRNRGDD